ncbi:MAG: hypothetical protein L6R39_005532 [Caloplaca ligustica]|nr:MAG: hypothetical protein L6R39_005532 [Caloplaca ligustica]
MTATAPAPDSIFYKFHTFESGLGRKTEYQGLPTEENNRLWKDLYRLADQSASEDKYIVVLSVFHHLHCLNAVRKGLYYFFDDWWNSTYNSFTIFPGIKDQHSEEDMEAAVPQVWHLDHCIDSLRQAIMCASDLSPYVFQWSEKERGIRAFANAVHTCWRFDAVSASFAV